MPSVPPVHTDRKRNADVKLMVGATVGVLLAGFLIIAGIYVAAAGGGKGVACGRYPVGTAADIRNDLETGGPFFQTGGSKCGFWLALDDGDVVAYRAIQPSGCTLDLKREKFKCGGKLVDVADLEQYPVSIITHDKIDTLIVDLTGLPVATTTSSSTTPATTATTPTTAG